MKLKTKDIEELAETIEAKRNQFGWSYARLAQEANVEASQVNKICHGHFKSLTSNVVQICTKLDVTVSEVTSGYAARLATAIVDLWDKTPADGARLLRLLSSLRDIRAGR